jgi:hypothetical protein
MIEIKSLKILFSEVATEVNAELSADSKRFSIQRVIVSPTEKHLVKKLGDKPGVSLAFKMPSIDSVIMDSDNYSEDNKMLFYVIEKIDPGQFTDEQELDHYNAMQRLTSLLKMRLMNRLMGRDFCNEDTELAKAFHTEFEFQEFGGWNGLSVSFDIKDFNL